MIGELKMSLQVIRRGEFNCYNNIHFIKGWVFSRKQKVEKIYFDYQLLDSSDIVDLHGPMAEQARFSTFIDRDIPDDLLNLNLVFATATSLCTISGILQYGVDRGPHGSFLPQFFPRLAASKKRLRGLEIGSRASSGVSNRQRYIPATFDFVGLDIMEGPDVDIVGNAHELSRHVESASFDCVYCLNTFDHLLMPRKVAVEINKVLKQDGIAMIFTHHTFVARKISSTGLSWDAPVSNVLQTLYPE